MPQETIRYSRKSLRQQGDLVGWLLFFLALATLFFVPGREALFMGFFILFIYALGWLTLLHEGAHIAYAYAHGISGNQITMKTGTRRFLGLPLRWRTSLNMRNIPKSVWIRLALFPLIIPALAAVLSFYSPAFVLLALAILTGSGGDFVYVLAILRAPGSFVTTTDEEIIVSSLPLQE